MIKVLEGKWKFQEVSLEIIHFMAYKKCKGGNNYSYVTFSLAGLCLLITTPF